MASTRLIRKGLQQSEAGLAGLLKKQGDVYCVPTARLHCTSAASDVAHRLRSAKSTPGPLERTFEASANDDDVTAATRNQQQLG